MAPQLSDVDGTRLPVERAEQLSRQMWLAGFMLLPWMWATSVWLFWPDFRSGRNATVAKYTRRSALCFLLVSAVFFAWMISFTIGGERVVGKAAFRRLNLVGLDLYALGILV